MIVDKSGKVWQYVKKVHCDFYFLPLIFPIALIILVSHIFHTTEIPVTIARTVDYSASVPTHESVTTGVIINTVPSTITTQMNVNKLDFDNRAITHIDGIAGLVLIFIKMEFERMKGIQTEILREIPSFYEEIRNTLLIMENTFSQYIEIFWIEINSNITKYDEMSIKITLVENITALQHTFIASANALNNAISNTLHKADYHNIEAAKRLCENVKGKFHNLLNRIHMFSEYDFSDNFYKDELFRVQREFAMLKTNITKTVVELDEKVYMKKFKGEVDIIKVKYQNVLNSYYANVTSALSYKVRFRSIMDAIQNRDLINGKYIWQLNTTKMSTLPKDRAFISETFTSTHPYKAMLLLYRDKGSRGNWKVTFHHEEFVRLNIRISILNQVNENRLICVESSVGESKKDDSSKVKKFFNIPLNYSEMKEKGYIKDDSLYVRCTADNHA